jgi:transcriptional regulator with XRE-family HTH domain
MPAIVRLLDEALRRAKQARIQIGDDLREARLRAGLSQAAVARAIGCSASTISRVERGLVPNVTIAFLTRHAATVGLLVRVGLFPVGSPVRDAGQLRVLNRLQAHIGPGWRWLVEMSVRADDLRAFDAGVIRPGCRVGFDVWARVRDVQAQARASSQKQLDGGVDRLILVFGDTDANRRAVRHAGEALRRAFPLTTRQVLASLREDRDPAANGIVFV